MRDYCFGNFLRELRMRTGLTQYQIGALVGVSDKAVSKWENGSSKPQSGILYKLSDILGISVDELLSCKQYDFKNRDTKGVFAMNKQLWDKAFEAMCNRYGNPAPIEIENRFFTEQAEMQDTNMIVYLDMLAELAKEAKKQGEHILVRGVTGSSFVSYLLGATDINPLKPHYYCPGCKAAVFDDSANDGWDLPKKQCSCGKAMLADGHNIPFEVFRRILRRDTYFEVALSPGFLATAKSITEDYFKDCKLTCEERKKNRLITIHVSSESSKCSFTFLTFDASERFRALEKATATSVDQVSFCCNDVLQEFQNGNTDGTISDSVKNILRKANPKSFHDLIQILGLSHLTGFLPENGEELIVKGFSAGESIAHRDDIFNAIQEKMIARGLSDTGFSYRVMEDTFMGRYAKNGIPEDIKSHLKAIGMEDWFIDSIGRIMYLFSKSHDVSYFKVSFTLMWYKVNYPKEFNEIML